MARRPFDPSRAAGAPKPEQQPLFSASSTEAQPLSVSQAAELIKSTLEQRIPSPLRVVGEVSNFSSKNHWYFSLKDESAVLSCVAFATAVRKFGFTPKDGDEVVATGHISHYTPQGRTQLYVSALAPVGAGALELRFRALCDELRKLGYFDEARKKPLPVFPRRIAVITSWTGAAVQDVINTAAQRCKAVALLVIDVRVQGDGAALEVANAIQWVDRHRERLQVDAILVTRGGGSIEDLWAFNERIVADTVFRCALPVVAAIGHESDTTIIELVADLRASTPTQAAMRLVPSATDLHRQIEHMTHRLAFMVAHKTERERNRLVQMQSDLGRIARDNLTARRAHLERIMHRLTARHPQAQATQRRAWIAAMTDRLYRAVRLRSIGARQQTRLVGATLHQAMARLVQQRRQTLRSVQGHLAAIDPHSVLGRGYSITAKPDGTIIRAAKQVSQGDPIITQLAQGTIESIVGSSESGATDPASRRQRKQGGSADQMNLFAANQ